MNKLNEFFELSQGQVRLLAFLSATALIMAGYLLARSYASRPIDAAPLPVFFADEEKFTGPFVLDPNTAPADSLELLPGIGKLLADRIVEYRMAKPFKTEIDITEVKGIGPKLYERLKPYLKVRR
jgi:competence protein ComEA